MGTDILIGGGNGSGGSISPEKLVDEVSPLKADHRSIGTASLIRPMNQYPMEHNPSMPNLSNIISQEDPSRYDGTDSYHG